MRRDCIPYGGQIDGWRRLAGRLFWCTGYPLALQLKWAYRQGWTDGNGARRERDFDRIASVSDANADYYVASVLGAER